MSLLFSMLSRFFIVSFFPKSKFLFFFFFSQLQSQSAVILDLRKINSVPVFIVSPCMCNEVMELGAIILVF